MRTACAVRPFTHRLKTAKGHTSSIVVIQRVGQPVFLFVHAAIGAVEHFIEGVAFVPLHRPNTDAYQKVLEVPPVFHSEIFP